MLQEKDANAEVTISIKLRIDNGIDEETINTRIVEGLNLLNIQVDWEPE